MRRRAVMRKRRARLHDRSESRAEPHAFHVDIHDAVVDAPRPPRGPSSTAARGVRVEHVEPSTPRRHARRAPRCRPRAYVSTNRERLPSDALDAFANASAAASFTSPMTSARLLLPWQSRRRRRCPMPSRHYRDPVLQLLRSSFYIRCFSDPPQAVDRQVDHPQEPFVSLAGAVAAQELDLHVVERIEVGKAVADRARKRRVVGEQLLVSGDRGEPLSRAMPFFRNPCEDLAWRSFRSETSSA